MTRPGPAPRPNPRLDDYPMQASKNLAAPVQKENDWRDHTLIPLARLKGWRVYFTQRSDRSPAGFPDLWLTRNGVLLVRELKRDGKVPTDAQQHWLRALRLAGVDAKVWRPQDWPAIQAELE